MLQDPELTIPVRNWTWFEENFAAQVSHMSKGTLRVIREGLFSYFDRRKLSKLVPAGISKVKLKKVDLLLKFSAGASGASGGAAAPGKIDREGGSVINVRGSLKVRFSF